MQGGDKETDVFLWFSFLDGPSNNIRSQRDSYTCQILISWPVRPEKGLPEVPTTAVDRLALMKQLSRDWADPFHSIIKAMPEDAEPITLRLEDWPSGPHKRAQWAGPWAGPGRPEARSPAQKPMWRAPRSNVV
jgi:hypothetical protein